MQILEWFSKNKATLRISMLVISKIHKINSKSYNVSLEPFKNLLLLQQVLSRKTASESEQS